MIQTVNGIVAGMILALVASGTTLTSESWTWLNFAHGELFMLGAYLGFRCVRGDWELLAGAVRLVVHCRPWRGDAEIVALRPLIGRDQP